MKVGISIPNIGPQATRENVVETAIQAEKDGFDSVWTLTRILWPLKLQSPYPGPPMGVFQSSGKMLWILLMF
jgi:alkanesulfonate monooxygenase SsuD/methylene tetrahydromethanopterin reductase-like flavin-dependent oxidoreductase (luciferase family)